MDAGLAEFQWQQQRRRKPFGGGTPVQGFGPDGAYTLWVQPAERGQRYTFQGGRAVVLADPGVAADAELRALRDRVVRSFAAAGEPGWLNVDVAFLDYTAAVLRKNYDLTDADLELVLGGTKWQDAMVRHVLGADDIIERLFTFGPELIDRITGTGGAIAPTFGVLPPIDDVASPRWSEPEPVALPIPPKRGPGRARAFARWLSNLW